MTSYNPYEHREITSKSTSNFETVVHLVKSSFGIGVLSLPFAITRSGYVMAIALGIPTVFIVVYGINLLIKTMVSVSAVLERPYTSYEESIKTVVEEGPPKLQKTAICAKYAVRVLLIAYPLGICSAYVIFMAHSLSQLYPLWETPIISTYIYKAILLGPVFLANCIPNLHRMFFFSAIADVLTLACFVALYYFIFGEEPLISGDHDMIGDDYLDIPLFVGTVLFSLEAISVILSIEERMKKPSSFFTLYYTAMFIVVLIYSFTGISGYIKYGNDVKPTINLNLPDTWVSVCFQALFIIIIYLSYPIQCYPVIAILWENLLALRVESKEKRILYEYLFRFGVTLFTVILAMVIPKFEIMITLVGALCISTLGLFLPGYLEYLYVWRFKEGKNRFTKAKDIFMMVMGLAILVLVTTISIANEIIKALKPQTTKMKEEVGERLYGL